MEKKELIEKKVVDLPDDKEFDGMDLKIKDLCSHKPKLIAIYKMMKEKGLIKFGTVPHDGPSMPTASEAKTWQVQDGGYTWQGYCCENTKLPNYKGVYIAADGSWIDVGYWKYGRRHGDTVFLTDEGECWIGTRVEGAWQDGSRTYFKLDGSTNSVDAAVYGKAAKTKQNQCGFKNCFRKAAVWCSNDKALFCV